MSISIGSIEAEPGERDFGYIEVNRTASQIAIHIPLYIINGENPGPTLLVDGGVHGAEIIGPLGIGQVLRDVDETELNGTLLATPVYNTSGFEFGTRTVFWDDKNLEVAPADPDGSPSNQLAHAYQTKVMPHADAYVNIHSGTSDSYVWYTIYSGDYGDPEIIEKSKKLAVAFGLEQIFRSVPSRWESYDEGEEAATLKRAAIDLGIPTIMPEIGGGADFLHNGKKQIEICSQSIKNVMRLMGMMDGDIVHESDKVQIVDAFDEEIWSGTNAGLMLMECDRGDYLEAGDPYASFYHPYTGEKIGEVEAPVDGIILNTGQVWPVVPQNEWLGCQGEVVEEISLEDIDLAWQNW